jgi:hypothetical protein
LHLILKKGIVTVPLYPVLFTFHPFLEPELCSFTTNVFDPHVSGSNPSNIGNVADPLLFESCGVAYFIPITIPEAGKFGILIHTFADVEVGLLSIQCEYFIWLQKKAIFVNVDSIPGL